MGDLQVVHLTRLSGLDDRKSFKLDALTVGSHNVTIVVVASLLERELRQACSRW